jgi:hypothetical protein
MLERTTTYGLSTTVDLPYDCAVERTREELGREGFGVLTKIDVQDTLRKKLAETLATLPGSRIPAASSLVPTASPRGGQSARARPAKRLGE